MLKECIYYENTHKYRQWYIILAILFSIGFVCGISAIIVYHIIKPIDILTVYQPKGEEFISTAICSIFLVYFTILIFKSKYHIKSICINKSEVRLVIMNTEKVFNKSDFISFRISRNYMFHVEYILNFKALPNIVLVSQKRRNISAILKEVIKHNVE